MTCVCGEQRAAGQASAMNRCSSRCVPRCEVDPCATGGGVEQRVLHVQHVQVGAAVLGETRRQNELHSRRIGETDGS